MVAKNQKSNDKYAGSGITLQRDPAEMTEAERIQLQERFTALRAGVARIAINAYEMSNAIKRPNSMLEMKQLSYKLNDIEAIVLDLRNTTGVLAQLRGE
jgi:hypothetical protein